MEHFASLPFWCNRTGAIGGLLVMMALLVQAGAAETDREVTFDVPAGVADKTLRAFSVQSGLEVVFAAESTRGVKTAAVRGRYAPIEALQRMLAGTVLKATQDPASRAFMINRTADPNAERTAR